MIKVTLDNAILKRVSAIDQNKYTVNETKLSVSTANKLRKNSKKKSAYSSTKIEGNPLTEAQANNAIDADDRKHFLKPEQEVRNYYLALTYLEKQAEKKIKFSEKLILNVQKRIHRAVHPSQKSNEHSDVAHREVGMISDHQDPAHQIQEHRTDTGDGRQDHPEPAPGHTLSDIELDHFTIGFLIAPVLVFFLTEEFDQRLAADGHCLA